MDCFYEEVIDDEDYNVKMIDELFNKKANRKRNMTLDSKQNSTGRMTTTGQSGYTDSDEYSDDDFEDSLLRRKPSAKPRHTFGN